ncbi:DUF4143 domain-containing protein [Niabella ginsengisoli]|uniref:DUF4143 domain-containing protein n=1 Tax=Niabella ginsengisoli TaxID=522298 RepID=A0ABS9SPV0_9BACT|nr:DUF4143 domain-containing protein [Niabella ginsengisoli]MCH5600397.1 DUF4143 domain-containing protein [Niabella ginsengisoli]
MNARGYFWRTVQQQEVDYIEDADGIIKGYEIKWNPKLKLKAPKSFKEAYNTDVALINKDNFREFL